MSVSRIATYLVVVLGVLWAGVAGASAAVELGPRYRDPINGFSLRPPAGATQEKQSASSQLINWYVRDEDTQAIAWTLGVHQVIETQKNIDLREYARQLATQLSKQQQFRIAPKSIRVAPAAGKPAIHFAGIAGSGGLFYQRQLWILAEPQRFLVLAISGPASQENKLDAIFEAAADTLRVSDPTAELQRRRDYVRHGQLLLDRLTRKELDAAVSDSGQTWYLFRFKGQEVGWLAETDETARRNSHEGLLVRTLAMVQLPDEPPRWMKRSLFVAYSLNFERWTESLQVDQGEGATRVSESALRTGNVIVLNVRRDGKHSRRKKELPAEAMDWYLPRAVGTLLPRLVNLRRPQAYGFATYNSPNHRVDMRTVRVVGPETITLLGRQLTAVRIDDQPNYDVDPIPTWVDGEGRVLRLQTQQGLLMERSTRSAVQRRFPDAIDLVRRTLASD